MIIKKKKRSLVSKTFKSVDDMVYSLSDKKFRNFWKKQRDQITVAQLACMRQVTSQAIRKAIFDGRINATKIGKQWVIRRADVS